MSLTIDYQDKENEYQDTRDPKFLMRAEDANEIKNRHNALVQCVLSLNVPGYKELYQDVPELLAEQANQEVGGVYYVSNAAADDPAVQTRGTIDAFYKYLGASNDGDSGNASLGDYELLPAQEDSDPTRIKNSTIGASYTLVDALHFSKIIYTGSNPKIITLNGDPLQMTEGFLSFHVNIGDGEVSIDYDDTLIEIIGHDPATDDLKIKRLADDPSKGGVQIDYIGYNSTTSKMEYHVYGALV